MNDLEKLRELFTAAVKIDDLIYAIDLENDVSADSNHKTNINNYLTQIYPLMKTVYDYAFKNYFAKYWEENEK